MVRHLGTPRARDASRSSLGTIRSISSLLRTTVGTMSTVRATAPAIAFLVPMPKIVAHSAKANRPATIEGMPVMTSTRKRISLPRGERPAYSTR